MVIFGLYGATAAAYTLAAVVHFLYLFRREFEGMAYWTTRIAFAVHTAGLATLILETKRVPVYTLFEAATLFTWILVANYLVIEAVQRSQAAGVFLLPVIAVIEILAVSLPKPGLEALIGSEFPASLIIWHVAVILLGYGFFVASFVASVMYLLLERQLRRKQFHPFFYRLPPLEQLDRWSGRFIYLGFPLLTFGLAAGMLFAHVTWQFWQADPKVLWTVLIWLLYGSYILMRRLYGWGGRRGAWLSIVGVAALLINYFVVNYLSGLHRFGV
jgi:cytochrome c-type biogenesis protein CcsB